MALGKIITVRGAIKAEEFGFVLPHEHVLCDFIGAEKTGAGRWDADAVVRVMLPYLKAAKERGVAGFADCTPAYIGRDPRVLERLARETGLHILTNTGYYGAAGDKFLPPHAFTETAGQLADRWVREAEGGIDGTGVRPGFIKIGVDPAEGSPKRLSGVDAKLVRAAGIASKRTGLTVASHTVQGTAALLQLELFREAGGDPAKFIYVHADGEKDLTFHRAVAKAGAWVEFDAVGSRPVDDHLKQVLPLVEEYTARVLLSMDRGWYNAGEPNGGAVRDYNPLPDVFLPALREAGVSEKTVKQLTVDNPARAFAVGA
jgi:predicted metal-dependent phosphotriesterase family hydrolase